MVKGLEGVEWPRQEIEGHGQFTVTAENLAFDVVLRAETTGTGADRAPQLTVESITVASQPTFHLDEKSLTIEGSTIDENTLETWKQAAADAFNSPDAGQALTAKLVDTLAQPSFRDQFSITVTAQLAKALDGVLGAVPAGTLPSDDSGFPRKYGPLEIYLFDRLRASVNDTGSGFYPRPSSSGRPVRCSNRTASGTSSSARTRSASRQPTSASRAARSRAFPTS
ncbi:hypothetical protein [Streptomyces sirii]|uniref:hypothetical protein n=1 Tax=Streptomyces sirii TaxID=3127701 RepID=UPI003D36AB41